MFEIPDLSKPLPFITATLMVFLVVLGRYLLAAGLFYLIFYLWYPKQWVHRKINTRPYKKEQFKREVRWSTITAFIFALCGAFGALLWQKGWLKLYVDIHDYPLWWILPSFFVSIILHETYYYWLHRWMHHPKIFHVIHKIHHDSNITSPWTAFSFHPLEGFLQAIFLPLLLVFMPMHLYVLIIQLTFMTLSSVVNHLDIELYPKTFQKHFIGKWLIGATHHSLHHKQFKYNFGLYFTFWDKWKNTESPLFKKLFEEKTNTPA